jgi:hypothetical protein
MESIVEQVKQLATGMDAAGREKLVTELRNLAYSMESPKDTTKRITSYVGRLRQL